MTSHFPARDYFRRVSWLFLTLVSAFLLGLYDYFKKVALHDNAVMPVLFGSVAAGALLWLPFVLWSAVSPGTLPAEFLLGIFLFREKHLRSKGACIIGILTGVILLA